MSTTATPTGKICTSCRRRASEGWLELDTMCLDCYDSKVISYHKCLYELTFEKAAYVREHLAMIKLKQGDLEV